MRFRPLLFLLLAATSLNGQEMKKPPREKVVHTIARATSAVRVDGTLDEQAWRDATVVPLNYEWLPGDNVPPPVKTEALVTYDDKSFLIAFRASDPQPSQIRAPLSDRDTAFLDDTVGFMLDAFNDQRRAFQFRINALGVQMDAISSDVDGSEDWSWDAIWASAGKIGNEGYVVEVAIPFSSLRFPNTESVQTWGFVAMRDYPRSNRHRMQSAPRNRNLACQICQLDQITGLQHIRPGRDIELDPTLTASRVDARRGFPAGPIEGGETEIDPGLTAKWGITPNVTLNGAINPDFSHVEADAAQLAVNERFALSFPEKRPFFLEGADFFSTPIRTVFTRTIADPVWAAKITGKLQRSAVGAFIAHDEVNNLVFPAREFSRSDFLDQPVFNAVLRYRLDVGKTSNVGLIFTGREGDEYHNRVGGVDGTIRFTPADTVRFQYLFTTTRYPDAVAIRNQQPLGSFSDPGYAAGYTHQERNWFWYANYRAQAPGFRLDSGFIVRTDYRQWSAGGERHIWGKPGQWFNRLIIAVGHDQTQSYSGSGEHESGWDVTFGYLGPRQTAIRINFSPNSERFDDAAYDNFRIHGGIEMRPSGKFAFGTGFSHGDTIDFANSRQADSIRLDPWVEFNIGRSFKGQLRHTFQRLDVEPGKLFDAHLSQARLVYHLNLRTFVRTIVQYTDVERNSAIYRFPVERKTQRLFSQLLFSYKVNPQTVLLAGYSDNALGLQNELATIGLTRTDRTFFVKIGYAWLL